MQSSRGQGRWAVKMVWWSRGQTMSSRCAMSCIFMLCDVLHLHVTVVPCRAEPQVGRDRPGQLRELPDPVRDLPGQVRELPDQVRKLPDRVRPRRWAYFRSGSPLRLCLPVVFFLCADTLSVINTVSCRYFESDFLISLVTGLHSVPNIIP